MLVLDCVTKRFSGLLAVSDASLTVAEGSITGLIGPNGAGKTTLFSLISGFELPTSGRIVFGARDVTTEAPHMRARRGIARTFQVPQPFVGMSVRENIAAGAYLRHGRRKDAMEKATAIGRQVGLGCVLDNLASSLTVVEGKRLELARALATEPKLLLLDEVLAGLNPSEIRDVLPVVRSIRDEGITILMVEHIMQVVMTLCERVHVLAQGRIIASGSPREICADPLVIEAYLGTGAAGRHVARGAANA
jgi:branched-chain amino acid transport system ATP-binding protein